MQTPHYEIASAKDYYGPYAKGSVLVRNGRVEFHGSSRDVKKLLKARVQLEDFTATLKAAAEKHFGVKGVTVQIKQDRRRPR